MFFLKDHFIVFIICHVYYSPDTDTYKMSCSDETRRNQGFNVLRRLLDINTHNYTLTASAG